MMPKTEITVSITDQDLMVCPTVRPKYSLTSQNPASLTWQKNSDPQPMASTSSDELVGRHAGREAADDAGGGDRGDRGRAGARAGCRTATSQPSTQHRDADAVGPVRDDVAGPRVDEHLLEPAAGGDDEQDARDTRQAGPHRLLHALAAHPGAVARAGTRQQDRQQQRDRPGCR